MSPPPVYLVTGAAGQLGSAVARLLRELEVELRCLDLAPSREGAREGEPWLACDLVSPDSYAALSEFCRPVTHVVHLASRVTDAKDLSVDLGSQLALEAEGTLNLLRALGSGTRHLAYASSMTVYGRPERLPVGEEHPLRPDCVYAVAKLAVERLLAGFGRERGIPIAAMRLTSLYGPGPAKGRAIPAMALSALQGRPPEVFGDGSVRRDYLYVDDAARATLAVSLGALDGPVNVGTGRGTSTAELARLILRLAGLEGDPRFLPRRLDEQSSASMVLDVRRLSGATRFVPFIPLEEGLRRTLAALRHSIEEGKEAVL